MTLTALMKPPASVLPPAQRALTMAQQLDAALLAGMFDRLNSDGRCELRALTWALEQLADDIVPPPVVARRPWWRREMPISVWLWALFASWALTVLALVQQYWRVL